MSEPCASARHLTADELDAGLPRIRQSPTDHGILQMIARRPATNERELLEEGTLDLSEGLVGDNWSKRGRKKTPPQEANPETQLTLMNARVAELVSGAKARWALAGDQLFVDLNIGLDNLPTGTRLRVGDALVEVTAEPHTGCKKFVERFGMEALSFVNSPEGRQLCLRGINAMVVEPGSIRVGDTISKA